VALGAAIALGAACAPHDPNTIDLDPPSHGVQIGTPVFDVAAGTEVQHCYYFKLPSDVDLDVTMIQIRYLTGSHHMNLFQSDQDIPDHDEDCWQKVMFSGPDNPNGWDLIAGSQSTALDWQLPPGVAFHLKAHRQLMLQTHYVNAATQNTPTSKGLVKVNLAAEPDPSKITSHMGTMFANNVNINIPPHSERSFSTTCGMSSEVHVAALTGHFHSRGRTFSVNVAPDGMSPGAEIYRSRAWSEPPFTVLDQPVLLPSGGGLYYTCDYQNDTDQTFTFGPHVETQEHCNLFAYYYPSFDHDRYCF
jgi:hypothetical protein